MTSASTTCGGWRWRPSRFTSRTRPRRSAPSPGRHSARWSSRALEVYPEPDRGIWEVRGEPRHFTASKVLCWVAVDRGAKLAKGRGEDDLAARWRAAADKMHADICAARSRRARRLRADLRRHRARRVGAAHPAPGLPAARGRAGCGQRYWRLPTSSLSTAWCCATGRTETDDGLAGAEGTFTICSFWLVSTLAMIGETGARGRPLRQAAVTRQPAPAVRRGNRGRQRPASRQLPAGVHAPGAHRRGPARDRRRAARRRLARSGWHAASPVHRRTGEPRPGCPGTGLTDVAARRGWRFLRSGGLRRAPGSRRRGADPRWRTR